MSKRPPANGKSKRQRYHRPVPAIRSLCTERRSKRPVSPTAQRQRSGTAVDPTDISPHSTPATSRICVGRRLSARKARQQGVGETTASAKRRHGILRKRLPSGCGGVSLAHLPNLSAKNSTVLCGTRPVPNMVDLRQTAAGTPGTGSAKRMRSRSTAKTHFPKAATPRRRSKSPRSTKERPSDGLADFSARYPGKPSRCSTAEADFESRNIPMERRPRAGLLGARIYGILRRRCFIRATFA